MPYDSDAALIDSICSLVIGKRVHRWDDSTITVFDREVHSLVGRMEDKILADPSLLASPEHADRIAGLAVKRMSELYSRLVDIVGQEKAWEVTARIADKTRNDREDG